MIAAGQDAAARPQTATGASQPAASAPQAAGGAFATGRHRNLFREAGHSDQDIRRKIDAAFQQLFHGDPATQAVFYWSGTFGPDAWRTAANWSVDWSWWAADPRERELSDRIQAFFESKGLDTYGNRWALDGSAELETNHSPALVATNAVASLAATRPRAARFVEALWNTEIPAGQYRYYDGLWYLMGLMHCSGEYRIWTPKWAGR